MAEPYNLYQITSNMTFGTFKVVRALLKTVKALLILIMVLSSPLTGVEAETTTSPTV